MPSPRNTVLSPCLVDGQVQTVEVDLDACPRHWPFAPCVASVWYADRSLLTTQLADVGEIYGRERILRNHQEVGYVDYHTVFVSRIVPVPQLSRTR